MWSAVRRAAALMTDCRRSRSQLTGRRQRRCSSPVWHDEAADECWQCWPWNWSSDAANLSKDAEARAHEPGNVHVAIQVDAEVAYWGSWWHLNRVMQLQVGLTETSGADEVERTICISNIPVTFIASSMIHQQRLKQSCLKDVLNFIKNINLYDNL